jgi:hypothetical protein
MMNYVTQKDCEVELPEDRCLWNNGDGTWTVKEHVYESDVTAPTCTADGYTTCTCTNCADSYVVPGEAALGHTAGEAKVENYVAATHVAGSYDNVVYCTVCGEELSRETNVIPALMYNITSPTLSLKGEIAINFYFTADEALLTREDVYFVFTDNTGRELSRVAMTKTVYKETDGKRYVAVSFVASEMTTVVCGQVVDADGNVYARPNGKKTFEYSIVQYAETILSECDEGETCDHNLCNLLKAMLEYGAYAKLHFSGLNPETDMDAINELTLAADVDRSGDNSKLFVNGNEHIKAEQLTKAYVDNSAALGVKTATLVLEARTTIRIYFKVTEGTDISNYTFMVDGSVVAVEAKDGFYCVDIDNIASRDLNHAYNVTVTNNDDANDYLSITYSALDYIYSVHKDCVNGTGKYEGAYIHELVNALYHYEEAAKAYFENRN